MSKPDITIVGAGVAGLTAALHLNRFGFPVTVFERSRSQRDAGTGIQLSPNAFKVLAGVGLSETLETIGFAPECIDIRSGVSGKRLTVFTLGEDFRKRHNAPYLVVHRAALARTLRGACETCKDIHIYEGAHVKEAKLVQDGVTLEYDLNGSQNHHQCRTLIGADGAFSSIRHLVSRNKTPSFTGHVAWRGIADFDDVPDHISTTSTGLWLGPSAHLVHYPIHATGKDTMKLNIVAITRWSERDAPAKDWMSESTSQQRTAAFSSWQRDLRGLAGLDIDWGGWPIYAHSEALPTAFGPVCLIGDAAHSLVPYGAQGGACGIEDAAILAQECNASPDDLADALRRTEFIRRRRVQKMMDLSNNNRRLYHLGWPMNVARNIAMRLAPQIALQRRMDWLYGWESAAK